MIGLIAFSDLLSPVTLAQWKKSILNTAQLLSFRVTNWAEGGFTRTMMALFATLYTAGSDVVRLLAASAFLDTAEGSWLKFVAKEVFNVDAIEATFASADDGLTLTNHGGGRYEIAPGDIIASNGTKNYRNTSSGVLEPGVGLTVKLDLIAEEAGAESTSTIGTITTMVTTLLGVTCSNDVQLTGLDAETDDALRQRCRDSVAARNIGGIKKAYEFFAKSATRPDGSSVGVTRVRATPPLGDGTLTVYLASADGAIPSGDVAIVQKIYDEQVTPYGLNATALSATNLSYSAACTIWLPAALGFNAADAQQIVDDALAAYVQTLPISGTIIPPAAGFIYWRAVLGIIEGSIDGMLKAQLASEVDVAVATDQVPVWVGVPANVTVIQVTE